MGFYTSTPPWYLHNFMAEWNCPGIDRPAQIADTFIYLSHVSSPTRRLHVVHISPRCKWFPLIEEGCIWNMDALERNAFSPGMISIHVVLCGNGCHTPCIASHNPHSHENTRPLIALHLSCVSSNPSYILVMHICLQILEQDVFLLWCCAYGAPWV